MDSPGVLIITPPTMEAITLDEAKIQCRVTGTTEYDVDLRDLIASVRELCEFNVGLSVGQQTVEDVWDDWPCRKVFELRRPPVWSFTSITYTDEDTVAATVPSTDYVFESSQPSRVSLVADASWPSVVLKEVGGVRMRYIAGYGKEFTVTADAAQDTLTSTAHGLANNQDVILRSSGALPGGLATDTRYWIRDAATDTLKLTSTPGGAAIDITSAGSGTHTLAVGIPKPLKRWMLFLIEQYFDQKSPVDVKAMIEVPHTVRWIRNQVGRWGF